jgi:hypothetical protein
MQQQLRQDLPKVLGCPSLIHMYSTATAVGGVGEGGGGVVQLDLISLVTIVQSDQIAMLAPGKMCDEIIIIS